MRRYRKEITSNSIEVRADVWKEGRIVHTNSWWYPPFGRSLEALFKRAHRWADKQIAILEKWETQE